MAVISGSLFGSKGRGRKPICPTGLTYGSHCCAHFQNLQAPYLLIVCERVVNVSLQTALSALCLSFTKIGMKLISFRV